MTDPYPHEHCAKCAKIIEEKDPIWCMCFEHMRDDYGQVSQAKRLPYKLLTQAAA